MQIFSRHFLTYLVITFLLFPIVNAKDLNVIIVGGGPTGLATAIEAYQNGDKVTVIEMRDSYTRTQTLFLNEDTIKLIKKWDVTIPELLVLEINKNRKMGVVSIKDLESAFSKKVSELGITTLQGQFKKLSGEKKIEVTLFNQDVTLPYDVLVGADGAHSTVRKELNIHSILLGKADGAVIYIAAINTPNKMDISTTIKKNDIFIKRIMLPTENIILLQSNTDGKEEKKLKKEQYVMAAWYAEWLRDANAIAEDKVTILNNFDVNLQQAETFSKEKQGVILVGEATATASFFHGTGLNSSFKTSVAAGSFLKSLSDGNKDAYESYNKNIKSITEELIKDSQPLWK